MGREHTKPMRDLATYYSGFWALSIAEVRVRRWTVAVDVDFLPGADNPPLGVGECAQGPTVAAIANALSDALRVRVRSLPLTAEQIVAAMP